MNYRYSYVNVKCFSLPMLTVALMNKLNLLENPEQYIIAIGKLLRKSRPNGLPQHDNYVCVYP